MKENDIFYFLVILLYYYVTRFTGVNEQNNISVSFTF